MFLTSVVPRSSHYVTLNRSSSWICWLWGRRYGLWWSLTDLQFMSKSRSIDWGRSTETLRCGTFDYTPTAFSYLIPSCCSSGWARKGAQGREPVSQAIGPNELSLCRMSPWYSFKFLMKVLSQTVKVGKLTSGCVYLFQSWFHVFTFSLVEHHYMSHE